MQEGLSRVSAFLAQPEADRCQRVADRVRHGAEYCRPGFLQALAGAFQPSSRKRHRDP